MAAGLTRLAATGFVVVGLAAYSQASVSGADWSRTAAASRTEASPAVTAVEPPQASWEQAKRSMGLTAGGDYVVVVDSSGSMAQHRGQVKSALRALLSGLTDRDRAALVSFRAAPDRATAVFPLQRVTDPEAVVSRLPVESGGTDISGGFAAALSELESSNEIRPAAVILVTDAQQTEHTATTARAWDAIRERIKRLRERQQEGRIHPLVRSAVLAWGGSDTTRPFPVGSSGCRASDSVAIAGCLFSREETQEVRPEDAANFLRRLPDEFGHRQFEAALAPDAAKVRAGDAVELKLGRPEMADDGFSARIPATFTSRTDALPLWVNDFTVSSSGLGGLRVREVRGRDHIELGEGKNGASVSTALEVTWDSVPQPWYALAPPSRDEELTIGYRLTSPYSRQMSRAEKPANRFEPKRHTETANLGIPAAATWLAELAVLAALALLLLVRLFGLPSTLWIVQTGRPPLPLRVWWPATTHRPGSAAYENLVVTHWSPLRALRGAGPLNVTVWPNGTSGRGVVTTPSHPVELRRRGKREPLPGYPGSSISRGGLLRPAGRTRT
ncbi:vWA domain-containing protein [Streptomyces sp. NBC_01481]|uniref:VWA domain-containing protein n=1 Tax=Streptomyces sp. NBC_01481 TaxID=2975869 RepID=UPI002251C2CF|nr:vWA domain-containing protein [Streptomyces sp. NBC_01481]MCX4585549.1 VWA domain-containing protein [Streptomyces sp. NBC_01481]